MRESKLKETQLDYMIGNTNLEDNGASNISIITAPVWGFCSLIIDVFIKQLILGLHWLLHPLNEGTKGVGTKHNPFLFLTIAPCPSFISKSSGFISPGSSQSKW